MFFVVFRMVWRVFYFFVLVLLIRVYRFGLLDRVEGEFFVIVFCFLFLVYDIDLIIIIEVK